MPEFFAFFIVLLVAVVFSRLFFQMRIPWVVSLIIGGILVGPNGLGWFESNETIEFLGVIGLVFLMFIAGLESKLSALGKLKRKLIVIASFTGLVPAAVGVAVGFSLGYSLETAVLLGIIFMSSAIAMLVPVFQSHNLVDSTLARTVIASAVIIDAISLLLLSVFLQFAASGDISPESLLIYPAALAVLGAFAWILPRLKWLAAKRLKRDADLFENELQFTVLVLIGLVVFFELIGLHAIIAGFFGGMILSKSMESPVLKAKLYAISYGFFIPVFFVLMGASTDISVFLGDNRALLVMFIVITSLLASKFLSGWVGGRLSGFSPRASAIIGAAVLPQLSTALAVAFLGFGAGLLDQTLLSSIVGLTIVTSILGPLLVSELSRRADTSGVIKKEIK